MFFHKVTIMVNTTTEETLVPAVDGLSVEKKNQGQEQEQSEDIVDPWNVQASSNKGIDYDKLIGTVYTLHLWLVNWRVSNFLPACTVLGMTVDNLIYTYWRFVLWCTV